MNARSLAWVGIVGLLTTGPLLAQEPTKAPEPVGRKLIEIYRVAPGQHEAFLRAIAQYDEANRRAGVPPRQLYVHSDGASWDFLLIQDADYPEGKGPLVGQAFKDLNLPGGPRFFTEFRTFILEHTDTFADGPTTAAAWLAELDKTPRVTADGRRAAEGTRYELSRVLPLGGTPRWDYVQVDAERRRLYVAHDAAVDVVDLDRQAVVGHVTGLAGAHGIALAPSMGRGFVSSGDRNAVVAFDLATLRHVGEARVGKDPDSVTFEPTTRRVLAWNSAGNDVTVLDAATLNLVKTLPLGGTPEFAVADGRGSVFVNIGNTGEIVRIDAAAPAVASRWALRGCESPTALAIDVAHGRLFSACGNGVLVAVDAATGRALGSAPVASGVDTAHFDAAASRVLLASVEGRISIVGVNPDGTLRPAADVPTHVTGRTLGFDPTTGVIYVPAVDLRIDWETRTAQFARDGLKLYVYEPRIP